MFCQWLPIVSTGTSTASVSHWSVKRCTVKQVQCTRAATRCLLSFVHVAMVLLESGGGLKRGRGPDAVGDLQHHSKQLRMLGQDPLPTSLHQAQLAGVHQGPFSQVCAFILWG